MKKLLCIILLLLCLMANVSHSQSFKMFGQLPSGQFAEGLVFYWRGIEAVEAVDESRYGNHGTITATWAGNGLSFNGSDTDYVDCGTSLLATASDSITIIARLEAKALTTETAIVGIDKQQYALNIGSDGRLYSWWGSNVRKDSTDVWVSVNTPITIAAVFNNPDNSVTYYVNGVAVETIEETSTPGPSATDDNFRIGIDPRDAAGQNFDGFIEHISVYFRALSASEIAALYINLNLPMQQPPIWLFQPPPAVVTGQVIIITKHEKKSTIMSILSSLWEGIWSLV